MVDAIAGRAPVRSMPSDKQVILTRQQAKRRWILHLLDDGEYTIDIDTHAAELNTVIGQYPPTGWSFELQQLERGLRVKVSGDARDRLLVLHKRQRSGAFGSKSRSYGTASSRLR